MSTNKRVMGTTIYNMPKNVYDLVTITMEKKFANNVAFRWVDDATNKVVEKTFAEFAHDIRKMVTYLKNEVPDIKGKKIVVLSRTTYEYGVITFGTFLAGAVLVTLNQKKTWDELSYELEVSEPSLIFTDGIDYGYEEQLKAAYGSLIRAQNVYEGCEPAELVNIIGHDDLLMLMFTSGTTGRSKGVMLSERNYFNALYMYVPGQQLLLDFQRDHAPEHYGEPLSHFTLVPMFHMSGFICYFAYSVQGWALNLCSDPRNFYRDMAAMRSDTMSTPPMLIEMIYNEIRRGHQDRLNGLWNLSCSSAILDPKVLRYLVEHGIFINQCYAMTETASEGLLNVEQEVEHMGALGKPSPDMECKLDETGELCIRGGCVMLGYYKDPEETAAAIDEEGWLHTGDLARVDEDGWYYMTGRKKNLIILGSGENVSPEELEKLVGKCTDVKEVVVKEMGKKIGAVVYCEADKQQNVRDHITELNRTLPLYKRITAVEFSSEPLPRNALGKLLRK